MFDQSFALFFDPLQSMSLATAIARLSLALFLGALIGWEREVNSHPAGLRTHMLIALAAALFTVIAMELTYFEGDASRADTLRMDPLRLIEAVTSGVAFLAAGSIIVQGGNVKGITTGASMWLAGAIGLACGTGDAVLAIIAAGLALMVLWLMRVLVKPVVKQIQDSEPGD